VGKPLDVHHIEEGKGPEPPTRSGKCFQDQGCAVCKANTCVTTHPRCRTPRALLHCRPRPRRNPLASTHVLLGSYSIPGAVSVVDAPGLPKLAALLSGFQRWLDAAHLRRQRQEHIHDVRKRDLVVPAGRKRAW
jgi:hypothetical protein